LNGRSNIKSASYAVFIDSSLDIRVKMYGS